MALARSLRDRLRRWSLRRTGPDAGPVELTDRRVYILPTRAGLSFGVVLLTMLLGSLNYSNNMGFALVFILASLLVVSMVHCQRNLTGLRIALAGGAPVFAGERLQCEIQVSNPGSGPRWQICAGPGTADAVGIDVPPGQTAVLRVQLPTRRRGRMACPAVALSTRYPLGFFRAWTWLHPDLELLVYPRPAGRGPEPRPQSGPRPDEAGLAVRGVDDFAGLRPLEPGEPPSRIAWSVYARTGELLTKDYRSGAGPAWLDWDDVPGSDTEARLSTLARMAEDAHAAGRTFGLRLPGQTIAPGAGRAHLHQCLRALALFEAPAEASRAGEG